MPAAPHHGREQRATRGTQRGTCWSHSRKLTILCCSYRLPPATNPTRRQARARAGGGDENRTRKPLVTRRRKEASHSVDLNPSDLLRRPDAPRPGANTAFVALRYGSFGNLCRLSVSLPPSLSPAATTWRTQRTQPNAMPSAFGSGRPRASRIAKSAKKSHVKRWVFPGTAGRAQWALGSGEPWRPRPGV